MSSIEWAKAGRPITIIPGDEVLADGNCPNENGHDDYIGVAFENCIIYGTPMQVLKALVDAARDVAQHMKDSE